ncbi:MAG: hypothetical protein ACE5EN_10865 [Nitrospinota bacterium]
MPPELALLSFSSAMVAFFHTLLGPDHYLPFVIMSRTGKWSRSKTLAVTFFCGIGHVLGSIVIGSIGVAFGFAVTRLETVESARGNVAAWALITFGLVYFVWGMRKAAKQHTHGGHRRLSETSMVNYTPWILFTIFVLGPCEPLIPLLMYPAAKASTTGLALVVLIFLTVTVMTMLGTVLLLSTGVERLPIKRLERYTHALAGATISLCGVAIRFLGL